MELEKYNPNAPKEERRQQIIRFIKSFSNAHLRAPNQKEMVYHGYPSLRSIQRGYGGIMRLRKEAGLNIVDLRSTEERKEKARLINKKALSDENAFYSKLVALFGENQVDREYMFFDDTRSRCDFRIKDKNIIVDVFYPSDKMSLTGCVGMKRRKYEKIKGKIRADKMYFVNLNNKISVEEVSFKKNPDWINVLDEDIFWNLIK